MIESDAVSMRILLAFVAAAALAGCATTPKPPAATPPATVPAPVPATPSSKYYSDDGPPLAVTIDLDAVPDAVPKNEPLHRFANRPYTVLGRDYVPATAPRPYRERGVASWYGRKFHGQLPSYARVTSVASGKSVVVRVNDRGPFLHGRIIDLSFAAAHRLGVAQKGSGEVVVEAILTTETLAAAAPLPPVAPAAASSAPVPALPPITEPAPAEAREGFVVQLGAFSNYANAQVFLAHVQNQMAAAEVEPRVRQQRGLWRVYVGPYANRDEASRVAERIAAAFGVATSVNVH